MKKKITIHKKNEIIRGSDEYSVMAKRALNTVYWAYQKHPESWKHNSANISFRTIRQLMNLNNDNRYVETIKDALRQLREPLELNNYYHPIQQHEYAWYSLSFLDEAGFRKDENGEWFVTVRISSLMAHLMHINGSFTPLDIITYANAFRTKYAMKLYEYLKSFSGYGYLEITHKHMMKLLSLDENSTYKYYSKLNELVERQIVEISKKSDLTGVKLVQGKALARERKFRIIIDPKNKKTVDANRAKKALENLIKRF